MQLKSSDDKGHHKQMKKTTCWRKIFATIVIDKKLISKINIKMYKSMRKRSFNQKENNKNIHTSNS